MFETSTNVHCKINIEIGNKKLPFIKQNTTKANFIYRIITQATKYKDFFHI